MTRRNYKIVTHRDPHIHPRPGDVMQKHSTAISRRVTMVIADVIFYRQGRSAKDEDIEKNCSLNEWKRWCETAWHRR